MKIPWELFTNGACSLFFLEKTFAWWKVKATNGISTALSLENAAQQKKFKKGVDK